MPHSQTLVIAKPTESSLPTEERSIPEGIPIPSQTIPYLQYLDACIHRLYGPSSVPLWAGEPVVDLEVMKVRPPTAEEIALAKKRKREKKAAAPKDKTASSIDPDNLPGGTVEMVPQLPVATVATKSPPQPPAKKLKGLSPPIRALEKQKQPALSLEDSSSPRTNKDPALRICKNVLTRHDRSLLKGEKLIDIHDESLQLDIKIISSARHEFI